MGRLRKLTANILGAALAAGLVAQPASAEKLVLSSSGGQVAQLMKAVFTEPFTKATGIAVEYLATTDRASALKAMVATGNTIWDVTELNAIEYATASLNGWLEPLDWAKIDPENRLPDSAKLEDAGIGAHDPLGAQAEAPSRSSSAPYQEMGKPHWR